MPSFTVKNQNIISGITCAVYLFDTQFFFKTSLVSISNLVLIIWFQAFACDS
jgi:hypothetical protein